MELQGQRVLILAENDYEDLELWYPKLRLIEAGAQVPKDLPTFCREIIHVMAARTTR